MELIGSAPALADLGRALASAEWVALDTEFVRERTYFARLCLIQIATPGWLAMIDPLALPDISPLLDALDTARPVKVLHAARQDLEVFHDLDGRVPAPVHDTQIAAAFLGHDDQIGYGALVQTLLGVTLDKAHTRTDWARRPLSPEQLQYARDDVRYLAGLYPLILEQLEARGRRDWFEQECERLVDPALYRADPAEAWRRLKGGGRLPPDAQQVLRELAAWRERRARERNLPRGWVLRDAQLLEIARRQPDTPARLAEAAGLEERALKRMGEDLLECVRAGRQAEPVALWAESARLTDEETKRAERIGAELKALAAEQGIAPALLGTRREIERLARGASASALLAGWRGTILGERLRALLPAQAEAVD